MKNRITKTFLVGIAIGTLFFACKKKGDQYGAVAIKMTDSPGNYYQVNVEITKVEVHYDNSNGWVTLATNSGIYNLLTLQNNVTAALASGSQVPAGKVSQMRLILGSHNSVMLTDSTVHSLTIPSSWNTGIKVNVDAQIPANTTLTITLDYDADASVSVDGNGNYSMNPVVKVKSIQ